MRTIPMRSRHRYAIALALAAVAAVAGVVARPDLPADVAIHWDAAGRADGFAPRWVALTLLPALAVVLLTLFSVLPRIDPLGENIRQFRPTYDWFAVLTVGVLAYAHGVVLALNLGYEFSILRAIVPVVAALTVAAGYVLERAERNWFVGIRTPWTLSDAAVWDETHRHAAPLFKLAGTVTLGGLLFPTYAFAFLVGPLVAVALYATGYSYVAYRRRADGA